MFKFALYGTLAIAAIAQIAAECPNACHGKGTCTAKDQCSCGKRYIGNDCGLKMCPVGYSWVDSPVGDLDMDSTLDTSVVLVGSQMYPLGTYEQAPVTVNDEGHHYRECSQAGNCNRETGECLCFEGFEGSACQRTSCPDNCNGVGVCEDIQEFASDATGTLYGQKQILSRSYQLWDAQITRGCKCDPSYYGVSCSKRRCRVGVDPMYECAGKEILETVLIAVGMDDTDTDETIQSATSYFRLRLYDYWGEMYETDRITISATNADNIVATQDAIRALPNSAFAGVTCGAIGDGNAFQWVQSAPTAHEGALMACEYSQNPGAHRTMELIESVVHGAANTAAEIKTAFIARTQRVGEDIDYFASKSSRTATVTHGSASVTLSSTGDTDLVVDKLVKIDEHISVISAVSGATLTLTSSFEAAGAGSGKSAYYSGYTLSKYTATVAAIAVGSTTMTVSDESEFAVGHVIHFDGLKYTVTSVTTTTLIIDSPYLGKQSDGSGAAISGATDPIWRITNTPTSGFYQYVDECSGRGTCDSSTGLCECFKGYTNDNCDTQNIMSL